MREQRNPEKGGRHFEINGRLVHEDDLTDEERLTVFGAPTTDEGEEAPEELESDE